MDCDGIIAPEVRGIFLCQGEPDFTLCKGYNGDVNI
jgi:hypothetical protein